MMNKIQKERKPSWLKVPFPGGERYHWISEQSKKLQLSTVCQEAQCPNIGECWNGGTATFMMMGDTCTRGCRFCAVKTSKRPEALDLEEPRKLAETIAHMKLDYVVLTSVNRDELADQGAGHIFASIRAVRLKNPQLLVEMLIPDFQGQESCLDRVVDSKPHVLAHNLETVERLTPTVRDPRATYQQSLDVLAYVKRKNSQTYTKSSLMLGLGETRAEVIQAMKDLRQARVDFLTLGQYLRPSNSRLEVFRYVTPEEFQELQKIGENLGFGYVASGPLVRSSYRAAEFYIAKKIRQHAVNL